jgi:hypothetical protein
VVRRLASLFDGLAGATYRILGWGVNDQAGTRCIDVTRPPIIAPDLLVESVTLNKAAFEPGETATAMITVCNNGNPTTGADFAVDLLRRDPGPAACPPATTRRVSGPALSAGGFDTFEVCRLR